MKTYSVGLHCRMQAFLSCREWGYSSWQCSGFSLRWFFSSWSTSSRCGGFSICSMQAQQLWHMGSRAQAEAGAHRLSCSGACGIFPHQRSNPCFPIHWATKDVQHHIFLSKSPADGHLGCFYILAITNIAVMNMEALECPRQKLEFLSFLYICPGVSRIAGSYGNSILRFFF